MSEHTSTNIFRELDTGWPWPLSSVQGFFEDMFNAIYEAPFLAVRPLQEMIEAGFTSLENTFRGAFKGLEDLVKSVPVNVINELGRVEETVLRNLEDMEKAFTSAVERVPGEVIRHVNEGLKALEGAVKGSVEEAGRTIIKAFDETFNAMTGAVSDALKSLGGDLARAIEAAPSTIVEALTRMPEPIVDALGAIPKAIEAAPKVIVDGMRDVVKGVFIGSGGLLEEALKVWVMLNPEVLAATTGWELWRHVIEAVRDPWGAVKSAVEAVINTLQEKAERIKAGDVSAAVEVALSMLGPGLLAAALAGLAGTKVMGSGYDAFALSKFIVELMNPSMVTGILLGTALGVGLRTPLTQYYRQLFRPEIPSIDEATRMYWRGVLSLEDLRDVIARRGFSEKYERGFIELTRNIPGASDLIRFVVREVITPEDFKKYMRMQGYEEYWSDAYWEAHWQLPAFGDLREAFWRGIITEEEFKKYIVWHDYKPEPRPGISKSDQDIMLALSYRLPGRIDARWMVRWGIIDKETLKTLIRMDGIHPDWVDRVAEAEFLNVLVDERTRLLSTLRKRYREGTLSRDEFIDRVRRLKFTDAELDLIIEEADESFTHELMEEELKYYKELLKRGLITRTQFVEDLVSKGWAREKIEKLADIIEARAVKIERRDLTKDERNRIRNALLWLYKEGFLTADELRLRLTQLGYSDEEIALFIDLADIEYQIDYLKDLVSVYREAFRKGQITRDELVEYLVMLGMRRERAETIAELEALKLMPRPRPPRRAG